MSSIREWQPTKPELAVGALLVLPIWNIIQGIIEDRPFWLIMLTTLGTLVLVLATIVLFGVARGPRG